MIVLVLTNPEYTKFVTEQINLNMKPDGPHLCYMSDQKKEPDQFPDEYDVGISFMYQHKIPAKEVNSRPWFNFHPAPLPKYKGRDLCYHAIMNGEKEFGATLHYMDENFDTGDIIEVMRFDVTDDHTAETLSSFAIETSKLLFKKYLPLILKTRVFSRIPNVGGTYYKKGQIIEEVPVRPDDPFGQFVRAVTYKEFAPRIDIGGVKYKIVREE